MTVVLLSNDQSPTASNRLDSTRIALSLFSFSRQDNTYVRTTRSRGTSSASPPPPISRETASLALSLSHPKASLPTRDSSTAFENGLVTNRTELCLSELYGLYILDEPSSSSSAIVPPSLPPPRRVLRLVLTEPSRSRAHPSSPPPLLSCTSSPKLLWTFD
jgi:hypothetical protein